jgi:hypothetical protein
VNRFDSKTSYHTDPGKYLNLYQKTKHAADEIALDSAEKGLPVKIVYPAFGYGCSQATIHPSMHEQTLFGASITAKRKNNWAGDRIRSLKV